MKTYIQNGHMVCVTAPVGGIISGDCIIVGSIFGVAAISSVENDPVEIAVTGVYLLPKASTAVLAIGSRVAWDNTAKNINVPATGRFNVGVATEAAGNGVTTVVVRLDGVATVAA